MTLYQSSGREIRMSELLQQKNAGRKKSIDLHRQHKVMETREEIESLIKQAVH